MPSNIKFLFLGETKVMVRRTRICGTEMVDYTAWVVDEGAMCSCGHHKVPGYGTITYEPDENGKSTQWGRVGTGPLDPAVDALPAMTDERIAACRQFRENECATAYRMIEAAFPRLLNLGDRRSGMISMLETERS